ncbi:MAG TPA: beta-galactosidase [Candidatus Brocadiaceae bacterium]
MKNFSKKIFQSVTWIFPIFLAFLLVEANCDESQIAIIKSVTHYVKNSNFERDYIPSKNNVKEWADIGTKGFPIADRNALYQWDNKITHLGKGAAKIIKTSPIGVAGLIQDISGLEDGKWFQASAWIKTEKMQIARGIDFFEGGASLSVIFFIKNVGNPIIFETPLVQKDGDWHEKRVIFVVPNNVERASIILSLRSLKGGVWFDDVSISQIRDMDVSTAKEKPLLNLDKYGGYKQIQGRKTGYFHAEKLSNRWWIIDPEGYGFIVIGVSEPRIEQHGTELYRENLKKYYKSKEEWLMTTAKRLKEWGFNTVIRNEEELSKIFVYDRGVGPRSAVKFSLFPEGTLPVGPFPDVFDERFQESLDKEAMEVTKDHKNNPLLLGYFTANELPWHGIPGKDMFDIFFALPQGKAGKRAVVGFLKQKYSGEIKSFNKIWGTNIKDFEELLNIRELKIDTTNENKTIIEDKSGFLRLVAKIYFELHYNAIKKYDPNHMILGVRFIGANAPKEVLEEMSPYVDMISFQPYTPIVPIELLEQTYELHGKPILITEFGFKANDSGLPNTIGPGVVLESQKDRYLWYKRYISRLLSSPIMVGWVWFEYVDEPSTGRLPDRENNNFGLVTMDDRPYFDLVNGMKELHSQIYPYLLGAMKQ